VDPADAPGAVRLTVWGVPGRRVPAAVARIGVDWTRLRGVPRLPDVPGLHGVPGLRFAKLLGTGDGRTFTLRDADPRHWALLTTWDDAAAADRFAAGTTHRRWAALAEEQLDVALRPIASRGRWSRREPFGVPEPARYDGPVASITRARLRLRHAPGFWRAVPPVSAALGGIPGLVLALGIGEAPIGLQGTFSLWTSSAALAEFAYRGAAHAEVIRRTPEENWYAEELFARFAVEAVEGTFAGRPVTLPGLVP
jgi:hypothetical protein